MDKPTKRISRRDAMKMLGAAAGATVLANLPSKWQTPQLAAGVLPAHAQTSAGPRTIVECVNGPNIQAPSGEAPVGIANGSLTSEVLIAAPDSGISMHYKIVLTNLASPDPLEGDALTSSGVSSVMYGAAILNVKLGVKSVATWTFTSPADGSGSCSSTFEALAQND